MGGMDDDTARTFGRRALLGGLGALALAGCSAPAGRPPATTGAPAASASPTTSPAVSAPAITSSAPSTSSLAPSSADAGTATSASRMATSAAPRDFAVLAKGLTGDLLLPADPAYRQASELFNPRFDAIHPQAVARCATVADVAACVSFARDSGTPLAIRSGGHCYEGWSTGPGLVIDTRRLKAVDIASGTATVGAGASLIDVYAALAAKGVGISGGSCPTVGIAGLTLGGGIGVVDRAWGVACDNLIGATVVTADGATLACSATEHPDLLWACQGGGGGTFGVVTSLTFRTRPTKPIATWGRSWPWSRAARVISAWLDWLPTAPDELWGSVHLSSAPGGAAPVVSVVGTYLGGDTAALATVLAGLESAVGSAPSSRYAVKHAFLDAMLIDAGCGSTGLAACHLEPAGKVARQAYAASSDWIDTPLGGAGVAALVGAVQDRHDTRGVPDVAIQLDAAGGAINRVAPSATAFVHRRSICSVQYIANWYDSTPPAAVASAAAWPHATRSLMQPYTSGGAYQNYADAAITDWSEAYFGANYPRLQRVKATYDPGNLFRHPQSVTA